MSTLYSAEFTDEKFELLNAQIKAKFSKPLIGQRSSRGLTIQHVLDSQAEILQNKAFSHQHKFYYLLLLLKSITDKGKHNWFMVFGKASLNKKAESILQSILLNAKVIAVTVRRLVKKNLEHTQAHAERPKISQAAFKRSAVESLKDACLHAAMQDIAAHVIRLPSSQDYLERFKLMTVIDRYILSSKII
jgi:tryptophan 2,3-dioxygenase